MKKLLLILLCVPLIGFTQGLGDHFKSEGHNKSKGFNFKIKTPIGFEQMEADRPNIIQKWMKNKNDNNKLEIFLIVIKDFPEGRDVTKEEWKDYLLNEGGINDFIEVIRESPEFSNANNERLFYVDQYTGVYFESDYTVDMSERLPIEITANDKYITMYSLNAFFYVEQHIYMCQMMTANESVLDKRLFLSLVNSSVFLDQYK